MTSHAILYDGCATFYSNLDRGSKSWAAYTFQDLGKMTFKILAVRLDNSKVRQTLLVAGLLGSDENFSANAEGQYGQKIFAV